MVAQGGIQAAARVMNKTHPSIAAAVKKLEKELGFDLFDRSGYRSVLTAQGREFLSKARQILINVKELESKAAHLRNGEEAVLNIIIGDITPLQSALKVLRRFVRQHPFTRLNLMFENLGGPNERLLSGNADLIIHHIDKTDMRYEHKHFCKISVIPVVAPGFLEIAVTTRLSHDDLADYTQCIVSDTAQQIETKDYFVQSLSPHIKVGDQYTKKEIILQGMAWGHMPDFLVKTELKNRKLLSIKGSRLNGISVELVVARLANAEHGIMAKRLWQCF